MKTTSASLLSATLIGAAVLVSAPCRADDKAPCSGDQTACSILKIKQEGTDRNSGAHIVIYFNDDRSKKLAQPINLELYLASEKKGCSGSVSATMANVNEGASNGRSIDGYLCKLRATWQRR